MSIQSLYPSVNPTLSLDFASTRTLDPRITFTRASTATFYDQTSTAVAEQNLITYSQAIGGTGWSLNQTSANLNNIAAPDGTTTATQFVENITTSNHYVNLASGISFTAGSTYTFSVYMQVGNGVTSPSIMQLWANSLIATAYVNFNISTGAVVNTSGNATGTITQVGSSTWYRCSMIITATSTVSTSNIGITFTNNNSTLGFNPSYLGVSTSNVYLWGAQLEQRSTATAYTPTTTAAITNYIPVLKTAASGVARFDCNPVTRESLGLLIEESRTNLVTYSSDYTNAAWSKTNITVTATANIAPDGTQTSSLIVPSVTSSIHRVNSTSTVVSSTVYTYSLYAKAQGYRYLYINGAASANQGKVCFDLQTGTIAATSSGTGAIVSIGNGWYRCFITATSNSTSAAPFVQVNNSGLADDTTFAGDGYSGIFIWGAQLEAGAFATSYIPTVASQVTRAADSASMTGTNFSSWYNAGQGSFYLDQNAPNTAASKIQGVFAYGADLQSFISLLNKENTSGQVYTSGFVIQANFSATLVAANKSALSYAPNNFAFSVNGTTALTDTAGSLPNPTQLFIGWNQVNGQGSAGTIKRIAYYPVALTATQLQAITS